MSLYFYGMPIYEYAHAYRVLMILAHCPVNVRNCTLGNCSLDFVNVSNFPSEYLSKNA